MRHASSILSLLLLASTAALGQAASSPSGSADLVVPPQSEACPVNLFAQRRSPIVTVQVIHPGTPAKPVNLLESQLELTLKPLDAPAIAEVYGIVHGPTFGPHIESASTARSGNIAEPFHLSLTPASGDLQHALLHIHTISNPAWVELLHITFTDGSRWNASSTSRCRVTPNGLLLVSPGAR